MIASTLRSSGAERRRGQGMTEYIIIVALVGVALITIISMFGNKIKFLFNAALQTIDGGKEVNPKSIDDPSMKTALGEEANTKDQDKVHTIKHFKSTD